ncbi:MAG: CBS domain-containing protein [Rhodocyclaceae bacterium]|nr:CBS domain-containing protein [Rhodocyclaceae bacterium]MCO5098067.1 CBS domain-containing protein [Rhodocyclaceae bacterium]
MIREQYKTLRQVRLERCASYYQAEVQPGNKVTLDSPATDVMTDLKHVQIVTIGPDATLVSANKAMTRNSVRSLLVADEKRCILGIITSTDILGEKPMQVVRDRGVLHEEVKVRDIMTPRDRLEVLDMKDVRAAEVGHVVATLQWAGRQHALVAEEDMSGRQMVRGIFSTTQISQQLGVTISSTLIASTFAEIEAVIAH